MLMAPILQRLQPHAGNVGYMTAGDAIPATQNVPYEQVPPGTDDCYDYISCD